MFRLPSLLLLCCCTGGLALAMPRASVEVLAQARAATGTVFLGDVAHVRSTDLELMRQLVNLPIARAPQPGHVLRIDREAVLAQVHRAALLQSGQLEWSGADQTEVQRSVTRVRGEAIANAAAAAARAALAQQGFAGEVQAVVTPRDVEVAAQETRLQARIPPAQLRGRLLSWVDVRAGDVLLRTIPVSLEVIRGVALPGRAAAPHPEALPVVTPAPVAPDPSEALVVTRGDWAILRSGTPGLVLESRVEVLQDGRQGQRVRVRQQGATGIVLGRVLGRGQLELAP